MRRGGVPYLFRVKHTPWFVDDGQSCPSNPEAAQMPAWGMSHGGTDRIVRPPPNLVKILVKGSHTPGPERVRPGASQRYSPRRGYAGRATGGSSGSYW